MICVWSGRLGAARDDAGSEVDQVSVRALLRLKYHNSITDALADLGRAEEIGQVFTGFQKYLYQHQAGV
jgi:type I restriction enzyme, R subunit